MTIKRIESAGIACLCRLGVAVLLTAAPLRAAEQPPGTPVFWTTGRNLMPQWGFYPHGEALGGTKPLGGHAAWTAGGSATLTWVADFPGDGNYHFWVRHYTGHGVVTVTVDEAPLAGARGGPGGVRYAWRHAGSRTLEKGRRHIDIEVRGTMFDAILVTADTDLQPTEDNLAEPVAAPVVRGFRAYRTDRHLTPAAAARPFVLGRLPGYEEIFYDWTPRVDEVIADRLQFWGAANQHVTGTFGIRALADIPALEVDLGELTGPGGAVIGRTAIDLRVVAVRERMQALFTEHGAWPKRRIATAELLLRDDRTGMPPSGPQGGFGGGRCATAIPAGQARQVWLTVDVPAGHPAGLYRGTLTLATGAEPVSLPLEIRLLAVDLQPAEGYYSICYPLSPDHKPERSSHVSEARYRAELEDMVRHGLNTVTLYGGVDAVALVRDAGMTAPPCIMRWPDRRAEREIAQAKEAGLGGLLYYAVDEPRDQAAIDSCLREGLRRREIGLTTMAAINSPGVWEALKDVVTHPVLINNHFGGRDNAAARYAREKGFMPISYWMTNVSYPLWHRAQSGLYNTACGYLGTMPWAYTDFADPARKWDPDVLSHQVTYPDEDGRPIPTLQWAAYRAGIDDVRYLQALRRAIAAGEARLDGSEAPEALREAVARAKAVQAERFGTIDGNWFSYLCRVRMTDLEQTRRAFAEATVAIDTALKPTH